MLDLITIVFREELPILRLQAESVDLYCQEIPVDNIYIIINDDTDPAEIKQEWWGSRSDCVKIIPRSVWGLDYSNDGWLTQQLLKLLAAANSANTWSLVLDAKTIIIQPLVLDRFFDQHDRLKWGYFPVLPVFKPAQDIVNQLFEIDLAHTIGPLGVPFTFNNAAVRSMIKDVELRTNQPFDRWFQQTGMVTEFILYSGYIQYRDGTLDIMCCKENTAYQICNVCHNEVERFDQKFFEMMNPDNLTVSIHRRAWLELTDLQRTAYRNFLIAHGIATAKELV